MQTVKETAANIAASAMAGMEKTKATVQEKVDRMKTRDPMEKQMATEKKEGRKNDAELRNQEARENNAVAKQAPAAGGHNPGYTATATYWATGEQGRLTGAHLMSALLGHGTGQPRGQVTEGVASSHPIGVNTGTGNMTAHNTPVEEGEGRREMALVVPRVEHLFCEGCVVCFIIRVILNGFQTFLVLM